MMKRQLFWVGLLLFSTPLYAATPKIIFSGVTGGVASSASGGVAQKAAAGDLIEVGATVQSTSHAAAEIVANDRFGILIQGESAISFSKFSSRRFDADLEGGCFFFKILAPTPKNRFKIRTEGLSLSGSEASFYFVNTPQEALSKGKIIVSKGTVRVYLKDLDVTVKVKENETLKLAAGLGIPEVVQSTEEEGVLAKEAEDLSTFSLKAETGGSLTVLQELARKAQAAKEAKKKGEKSALPAPPQS